MSYALTVQVPSKHLGEGVSRKIYSQENSLAPPLGSADRNGQHSQPVVPKVSGMEQRPSPSIPQASSGGNTDPFLHSTPALLFLFFGFSAFVEGSVVVHMSVEDTFHLQALHCAKIRE